MLSFEGTGRTIEKAIESALLELKAKREDVDIKILEEGGLFKKAKVLVTISDDCRQNYEKKIANKIITNENIEELDVKAMFADLKNNLKKEDNETKEIKKEAKKEQKIEKKEEKSKEERNDKENIEHTLSGEDFIKGLLEELKIDANVSVEETVDTINISIEGGNSGDLIGYRGECLNALQYIASIVENERNESRKRLVLDIEKYRARREESLKGLAHRMENKVMKTSRSIRLEPMNANERRIIHTELQDSESVTTTSKGLEPNRFVVILPKREGKIAEESSTEEE